MKFLGFRWPLTSYTPWQGWMPLLMPFMLLGCGTSRGLSKSRPLFYGDCCGEPNPNSRGWLGSSSPLIGSFSIIHTWVLKRPKIWKDGSLWWLLTQDGKVELKQLWRPAGSSGSDKLKGANGLCQSLVISAIWGDTHIISQSVISLVGPVAHAGKFSAPSVLWLCMLAKFMDTDR